jgi:hypothetical protein
MMAGLAWEFDTERMQWKRLPTSKEVSDHFGIKANIIRSWWLNRDQIAIAPLKHRRLPSPYVREHFPTLELRLYQAYQLRNQKDLRITLKWMIRRANRLYRTVYRVSLFLGVMEPRTFSASWVKRFMKRQRIARRKITHVGQALLTNWKSLVNEFIKFCRRAIAGLIGPLPEPGFYLSQENCLIGPSGGNEPALVEVSQSDGDNILLSGPSAALMATRAILAMGDGSTDDDDIQAVIKRRVIKAG